jgi:hypothetical protein
VQPVEPRHLDVADDQVWMQPGREVDPGHAIACLTDDVEVVLEVHQDTEQITM